MQRQVSSEVPKMMSTTARWHLHHATTSSSGLQDDARAEHTVSDQDPLQCITPGLEMRCGGQTPSSGGNQNRRSASHGKYRTCDTCSVLQAIDCSTGGNDGCGAEDPQVFDDK
uniref:Uncharacterized protein n=3 Tax=Nothobranchius TaxID=28779 RepID=A0A1A8JRU9_NOTKU